MLGRLVRASVLPARLAVIFCIGASASITGGAPAASQGKVSMGEPFARHHEVSIRTIGGFALGLYLGSQPGAKVSIISMRPPQQGQGRGQCAGLIGLSGLHGEQVAHLCDALGTIAVGEQAVVADAMEAFRQHVH